MVRLAQKLIKKFLDRINPEKKEQIVALEKGTNPVPWTLGMLDFGHPRIIRSNHFASGLRYDLALKGWNYVLFEPRNYPESESFFFNDEVYARLKRAGLPRTTLEPLLEVHDKSFDRDEINIILMGLIQNQDYKNYSQIIKSHARVSQNIDRLNLAAAHYNLGLVYNLRSELELAGFHFARANAYNPHEKYLFERIKNKVIPNGKKLIESCRNKKIEVIYTVVESLTLDGRDRSLDYKISGIFAAKGSWQAEVVDELKPLKNEIIIPKTSSSLFNSTNFEYVLRNLSIQYLMVMGIVTDQCVETAVRDGCDRGFLITLIEDACATHSQQRHDESLIGVKGYCRIRKTEEILKEIV